jgi:endonuclease/exonuclease/phosphatase (EEP) superfamily protein YafD
MECVSLHLTHLIDDEVLRRAQLETILGRIQIGPALLGGDFNATPDAALFDGLPLTDCRILAGVPAAPTCEGRCIDHVMAAGWSPQVDDVRLVLSETTDGIAPSDHAGIAIDFGPSRPRCRASHPSDGGFR